MGSLVVSHIEMPLPDNLSNEELRKLITSFANLNDKISIPVEITSADEFVAWVRSYNI